VTRQGKQMKLKGSIYCRQRSHAKPEDGSAEVLLQLCGNAWQDADLMVSRFSHRCPHALSARQPTCMSGGSVRAEAASCHRPTRSQLPPRSLVLACTRCELIAIAQSRPACVAVAVARNSDAHTMRSSRSPKDSLLFSNHYYAGLPSLTLGVLIV
jgi:hypothetical protein